MPDWDAAATWETFGDWSTLGAVTYGVPETYLGFLTYAGDAQLYGVATSGRQGPEAKKGTH